MRFINTYQYSGSYNGFDLYACFNAKQGVAQDRCNLFFFLHFSLFIYRRNLFDFLRNDLPNYRKGMRRLGILIGRYETVACGVFMRLHGVCEFPADVRFSFYQLVRGKF